MESTTPAPGMPAPAPSLRAQHRQERRALQQRQRQSRKVLHSARHIRFVNANLRQDLERWEARPMRYERADLVRYSIALLMAAALLAAAVASSGKNQLIYAIVALTPAAYAAMVLWSGAKPLDELADVRELFPLDYDPPDTLPDEEITPEAMRARRQAFKQAAAESRRRAADQGRTVNAAAPAGPAAGERQHRGSGVR